MKDPGVGEPGGYPPYALTPWDDRRRWTEYLRACAVKVLEAAVGAG